jgi:dUTP pyrophosphatase
MPQSALKFRARSPRGSVTRRVRYHEPMLRVKLLDPSARSPVVAHPGEDLGYDLFSLETVLLASRSTVRVRTGIAVEARHPATGVPLGLLVRDRSSIAAKGIAITAGVIDAGYRGEILILITNLGDTQLELKAGEKIAQMIPIPVLTGMVEIVSSLEDSARAGKGFGSSGA